MAKTLEDLVVGRIENQLYSQKRWFNNNFGSNMAKAGVPDIITMDLDSKFLAIECKRDGETPSMNQWNHAFQIIESGGRCIIAQEDVDLINESFPILEVQYDPNNIGYSSYNAWNTIKTLHGTHEIKLSLTKFDNVS